MRSRRWDLQLCRTSLYDIRTLRWPKNYNFPHTVLINFNSIYLDSQTWPSEMPGNVWHFIFTNNAFPGKRKPRRSLTPSICRTVLRELVPMFYNQSAVTKRNKNNTNDFVIWFCLVRFFLLRTVLQWGKIYDSFKTIYGTRQGGLLSSLLFLIEMAEVFRRTNYENVRGIVLDHPRHNCRL